MNLFKNGSAGENNFRGSKYITTPKTIHHDPENYTSRPRKSVVSACKIEQFFLNIEQGTVKRVFSAYPTGGKTQPSYPVLPNREKISPDTRRFYTSHPKTRQKYWPNQSQAIK